MRFLFAFRFLLLAPFAIASAPGQQAAPAPGGFVGSQACAPCHAKTFAAWKKTRMANVVQDPKVHPEAVLGDFSKPDPLVKFRIEDVAFIYGSKWKQRYFTKVGDDYFVFPAQWDVQNRVWRPYSPKTGADWWTAKYPADPMQRPTGPLCDGCHSVNYNIDTKQVTEWNVGCEKCHGAGGAHARQPSRTNIVNPARLDFVRANDICLQCHTQGQPKANPIQGRYYDWPAGYQPGGRLDDFWKLESHTLGQTTFTHFAEGSAHKNRMQGNDFVTSRMHERGVNCFSCHNVHGTDFNADVIKPGNAMCLECHGPHSPNGPHGSLEEHTHHRAASEGSDCVGCHMPKIAQTVADVNVRSHTFRFVTPAESETYNIPNACLNCHKNKTNAWAGEQLAGWVNVSSWRMAR